MIAAGRSSSPTFSHPSAGRPSRVAPAALRGPLDRSRTVRTGLVPLFFLLAATALLAVGCGPSGPEGAAETRSGSAAEAPAADSPGAGAEDVQPAGATAGELPWQRLARPEVPADRPLRAGFLVVDGVYNSELMAPYDVFQHTVFHTDPGIDVFTVSPDGGPITTFEGLHLVPHHGFDDAPPIDILVVPSAEHSMDTDLQDEELIGWVRRVGEDALYLVSLCDGAFVLAQAGLLDGVACTTFPADQDRFAEMFPDADLRRGPSFVHHGRAVTSEGGARSYEPAMYLVDHLYGPDVARGIGQGLLIPWPPSSDDLAALVLPGEPTR